ncbi:TlpA family protein disulfide reductase [Blastococcus sp. TML/M2B]|uniref:TlpA family protein disulfide reductase n=1 Tax=unclassified Blastococcus TaxID=2619396 RepID=UPI00190C9E9A|nr:MULTISPECIES: TlpA disulfide reductase family protein [unclassified Blastococcus]MBN1091367.1 TlpA family protein disulfide reductase [Blastococcus sp. TML/M2B]MBN1095078.1 TlpA family protein disulfide reductase [Blastococcus sp. TML/C7B]
MRVRFLGLAALLALTACTGDDADDAAPSRTLADATALEPCPEQPDQPAAGAATLPPLVFDCLGGGSLDLGRAPGVPTLVNLWGSWCAPCRTELPLIQEFATAAGDRVRVLGVISKDGAPQADSLAADLGITFPGAFDGDGELMDELGINALPFTYFLDADGALVHTEVGQVTSVEELRTLVAEHLGVQL